MQTVGGFLLALGLGAQFMAGHPKGDESRQRKVAIPWLDPPVIKEGVGNKRSSRQAKVVMFKHDTDRAISKGTSNRISRRGEGS
jgi:hypothetical protein